MRYMKVKGHLKDNPENFELSDVRCSPILRYRLLSKGCDSITDVLTQFEYINIQATWGQDQGEIKSAAQTE